MRAAILAAALLLSAGLVAAPAASANHIPAACGPSPAESTCQVVADVYNASAHYATCYLFTAPTSWVSDCL